MCKNAKVIVVGADHHNTLNLIRALGIAGFQVIVYVTSENGRSFVTQSRYVDSFYILENEEDVVFSLLNSHGDVKVPIITTSDKSAETLDLHFDELSQYYILPNCSFKQGMISNWMNKDKMLKEADKCGLKQPLTMFVDSMMDIDANISKFCYPCIVKPLKSSSATKNDFRICHKKNELKSVLYDFQKCNLPVVVQQFVKVDYEFLIIGCRCRNTKQNHIVGGLHKKKCCKDMNNMGMFVTAQTTPELPKGINIKHLNKFLSSIDYEGMYSVEFMISGEDAYFTEINLRNDGCLFCWTNAGCNIASTWVEEMIGGVARECPKLLRKHALVEISYVKYYGKNLLGTITDFAIADTFAIFDKRDVKPFIYKFINAIK